METETFVFLDLFGKQYLVGRLWTMEIGDCRKETCSFAAPV
ncbi:hypothetical protein BH10CYA1_BH10CYA1_56080 [soil metagenome]